jgi:hypothetical protein
VSFEPDVQNMSGPAIDKFAFCFFVFIVWGLVISFIYRPIMGFWDLEDSLWQMPYLILSSIISLIIIGTASAWLIKAQRAEDAAGQNKK